jgi:hypothetical protein
MAEFTSEGYLDLSDAEKDSEISQYEAGLAGIVSGLIKVPEGIVSLGAELIDLGLDTNSAAQVEQFFDDINPFEEIADKKAAGRITEALVQVGIPGAVGFKTATKLADKALKAKKANNYVNFKNPNLIKAVGKASDLNRKAKVKRFAAGVAGGAAGEAFVADVEKIGTFGDLFGGGPTELDTEVVQNSGSEDATRKLFNRLKFGSESLLVTPFVYGAGKMIKAAATRGKNIEFSNSKMDRYFNKVFSGLRARGAKPQQIFEDKMLQKGLETADLNRATELVKQIDTNVDKMFPTIKTFFDRSANQEKVKILKEINDAMFSGQIDKPIPNTVANNLTETLTKKKLKPGQVNELFGSLNVAREVFADLINSSSNAPKDVQTLKNLMGDRIKDYLGNTYAIFEDKSILPFKSYTPTDEAIQNAKDLFVRYAAKKKNPITAFEAEQMVDDVIKSALEMKAPGKLPYFKYTDLTPLGNADKNKKFFKQVVTNDINGKEVSRVVGQGSKVFRELFGKIEDPRFSVYNGIQRLSAVARKNQLFDKLANDDLAVKRKVTPETPAGEKGFFFDNVAVAERALPYQEIVKLDDYVAPFFRDEYAVNPLAGKFTSKDIAQALGDSQKSLKFLFEPRPDATGIEKAMTWGYRNLVLFPKAASQVAKTILAPVTHFRNLFSATGFSAANGIFFENPAVVAKAFKDAFPKLQVGTRSAEANKDYRELLELGVVNSQVQIGDLKNLLRDIRFGENLNIEKPLQGMMSKLFGATKRGLKKGQKFAEDLYTAEDDLFKITNYAVELSRLKNAYTKAGREFTERQLKEEAADIVRNTVPNYAYVSDFVRALRRLPLGNFMSFPSEILRTTTNIAQRAIKEIKDPALRNIGLKRLVGMATVTAAAPIGLTEGFKAIYDVTDEQLESMRRYLPDWSKNSTILPIRDEDTGELKYIDFSHGNAYDTVSRPFQTLLNNVQQGITDEEVLMKGFIKGISEAAGQLASPFIDESIFTEAMVDLSPILGRNGRTREGKQLYDDDTPMGDKISIISGHLASAMLPFSYPQFKRIYQAATDKPSERGEFFELPDELLGFAGYRAVKLDPIKSLGFKLNEYRARQRKARTLFTGGEFGVLKGGPVDPNEIIKRYIAANKAKFEAEQDMLKDVVAAEELEADMSEVRKEFRDRGLGRDYNDMLNEKFDPYFPSQKIQQEFKDIESRIDVDNPFEEVKDVINEIKQDLRYLDLTDEFDIEIEDYLINQSDPFAQSALPPTPMPSANVVQTAAVQAPGVMNQGLTPTENALLSEEEKQITLRNRGLV